LATDPAQAAFQGDGGFGPNRQKSALSVGTEFTRVRRTAM
jgi:hypothetical protein